MTSFPITCKNPQMKFNPQLLRKKAKGEKSTSSADYLELRFLGQEHKETPTQLPRD